MLSVRVTCRLPPFPPNGDRVPVDRTPHRRGVARFVHAPGCPVPGAAFARAGDRWFAVPRPATGVHASATSTPTTGGRWTPRRRRRARAAPARTARGRPDTVEE